MGQHDAMHARALLVLTLLVTGCGIQTSVPDPDLDVLEVAARTTSELERYRFDWVATYELTEPDEAGRETLTVAGSGSVDTTEDAVIATFEYDESFVGDAERLFGDASIETVRSETRIVDGEVYVRGFNAAAADPDADVAYDQWYRVTERRAGFADPFNRSALRPAEAVDLLAGAMDDPDRTGDTFSQVVDRDVVLGVGERFPGSLLDFGFRIGGGDFELSMVVSDGLVERMVIEGDDVNAGVEVFRFDISFVDGILSNISAPESAETLR